MIIVLADNLGLRGIAEGGEFEEQRDFVARNGLEDIYERTPFPFEEQPQR